MKNYNLLSTIIPVILVTVLILAGSCRKSDYEIESQSETITDNGSGIGSTTWTSDVEYLIEGMVFVNDGQELAIEAGTVIRAKTGQGTASSALIVARGGKIIAQGTAENPIIFTVEGDDLQGSVPIEAKGLWGGVIILGAAPLNLSVGEAHIEGISVYEPRGVYGGFDEEDNSGIFSYVSIRHCGTNIGEGNEINGLTLGGVGNKTMIDHIEVISSADDGFEIFGGSVNLKYIVAAFCGDDAVDYDLGYRGLGQFWFAWQEASQGDKLIEADGGTDPITGTPYAMPQIFNVTMIGRGNDQSAKTMSFSRNAAGQVANSIFIMQGDGVAIEYVENSDDSYKQFEIGLLKIENSIFYEIAENTIETIFNIEAAAGVDVSEQSATFQDYFLTAMNSIQDPGITVEENYVDPLPKGNVYDDLAQSENEWFESTAFKGAFYTYNWLSGWTLLDQEGFVK